MNTTTNNHPPAWYWIATALAALYALFGIGVLVFGFTGGFAEGSLLTFSVALTVIAIIADVVGVSGLIIRRSWAVPVFALGVVAALIYCAILLPQAIGVWLGAVCLFALPRVLMLWLAIAAKARGWLADGAKRSMASAA